MQAQSPWDERLVRDTLDRIFRGREYSRSLEDIIWSNIAALIDRAEAWLLRAAREHPVLFWTALVLIALIVGAVFVRGYFLARQRAALMAKAARAAGRPWASHEDPWRVAQELAGAGKYADAAHALYAFLLEWLASQENVELHPSKTVGDYGRDLRAKASRVLPRYRDFARSYEVVVYGEGTCDRTRYERLLSLANAITAQNV